MHKRLERSKRSFSSSQVAMNLVMIRFPSRGKLSTKLSRTLGVSSDGNCGLYINNLRFDSSVSARISSKSDGTDDSEELMERRESSRSFSAMLINTSSSKHS